MKVAYPPVDCSYRVDRDGVQRWFADVHELTAWFELEAKAGRFDPGVEERDQGYLIFCESDDAEPVGISWRHPRLIHARLYGRKTPDLGSRSTPGTTRPPGSSSSR